jgi:NAD(P)-dependent dehydrogenase (short-subunit alcohol dehydrogenase family)
MSLQLQEKVALVTGGASGIGRTTARRLAAEGAAVVVADLNGQQAARTVEMIEQAGGRAIAVTADVTSPEDNRAMFDAAANSFGGLDFTFLNAGKGQASMNFSDLGLDVFETMINVNLRGAYLGMRLSLERLRAGGACLVTASLAGVIGIPGAAAYSASKHGVLGLVRSAARDFADKGLRVNALCPGIVITPMNGYEQDDTLTAILPNPEYRGSVSAQHVAEVALFLLSHNAAGINGYAQVIDSSLSSTFPL